MLHAATIGSYVLQDGDYVGVVVLLFLVSVVLGFLLIRWS